MLGVDPDTLRRWADDGRVEAWTTPGGHRRFDRRALEQLAASRRGGRRPLASLGATPARVSRAYRRSYDRPAGPSALSSLVDSPADRDAYRDVGRRLVEALIGHLDANPDDGAARDKAEATAVTVVDELARRLAQRGTSLTDAVALFVASRRPFLAEIASLGRRRRLDPVRLATVYEDASGLLDRLLLRFIATHQESAA